MPSRPNSHVIQSGSNKGLTVGQVKARKKNGGNVKQQVIKTLVVARANNKQRPANKAAMRLLALEKRLSKLSMDPLVRTNTNMFIPSRFMGRHSTNFYNNIPGISKSGRAFLLALTHPNCETGVEFDGIVDSMPDEVNPFTAKDDSLTIGYSDFAWSSAPTNPNTCSIEIYTPPIPEIQCIARCRAGGKTSFLRVFRNPGFTKTAHGVPGTGGVSFNSYNTYHTEGYDTLRCAGSGLTIIPIASGLNDGGNLVWGQLPGLVRVDKLTPQYAGEDATNNIAVSENSIETVSQIEFTLPQVGSLTQLDKKSADGMFKEGAYIVHVPTEPMMTLKKQPLLRSGYDARAVVKQGSATPIGQIQYPFSYLVCNDANNPDDETFAAFDDRDAFSGTMTLTGNVPQGPLMAPNISGPYDMLTGFVYASGLSTGNASGLPEARMKVRRTLYYELYPDNVSSNLAVYRTLHPEFDFNALKLAALISQRMPHALLGSDNAFSGVLGKIWDVIFKVGKPLTAVGSMIPQTAGVSRVASGVLDGINNFSQSVDW